MIYLTSQHKHAIEQHAARDYPFECCGLLLGEVTDANEKEVTEVYAISNAREEESKRNRFLITPEEYLAGEKRARERNLDIVGIYHSHPDSAAHPSQYDLDYALPFFSYIIVAVMKAEAGEMFSWLMRDDRSQFDEEQLIVKGDITDGD